ncbi:hypothetical protein HID58_039303 [Brassica napus]|uniref:Uncharacterized protein n=2 Tax=Brassica TaxID=3705 RepID=A0ABQ8BTL5_BRANA|nr:hypothetical protein HID58_039303 [Brassica napus]
MGSYYYRRKSRKHITTVAFIILLLLFLFLYAKASSSSSLDIPHHSTHASLKKPRVLDPKLHDRSSRDASRGSKYTSEGGGIYFEDNKRRVFTEYAAGGDFVWYEYYDDDGEMSIIVDAKEKKRKE